MATSVTYGSTVTAVDTITSGVPAISANQSIRQDGFNTSLSLNGTSTPNVKQDAFFLATLSAGANTFDFTNLTAPGGANVSFSGYRVRFLKLKAPAANGAAITAKFGATNGYTGFGSAFNVTIPPGGEVTVYDGGAGGVVSSTNKTIDLAGTGSADLLQVTAVSGS